MNFKEIITQFLNTENVGYYMIHLERAKERLPVIHKLQDDLHMNLVNFEGIDGVELLKTGFPTSCAHTHGSTRGAGDIGATVSHYKMCCLGLEKGYDYLVSSAIKGKNAMPARGGASPDDVSDFEIARAVVYMANASGGKLKEPKEPDSAKDAGTEKK
jgi:hypothetical protein